VILFKIAPQSLPLHPLRGDGPRAVYMYTVTPRESPKDTGAGLTIAASVEELTERRFWKSPRL